MAHGSWTATDWRVRQAKVCSTLFACPLFNVEKGQRTPRRLRCPSVCCTKQKMTQKKGREKDKERGIGVERERAMHADNTLSFDHNPTEFVNERTGMEGVAVLLSCLSCLQQ